MHVGGYGVGMGFGGVFMIVFWILLIFGVVFIVKTLGSGSGHRCDHETAPDILDKRYAKGELSHDEYVAARKELGKNCGL